MKDRSALLSAPDVLYIVGMRTGMILLAGLACGGALCERAFGDAATVSRGQVPYTEGAAIYQHVCQGCHMPGGRGASGGAGAFPALANNTHLEDAGYPVSMVLNGHGAMPWFNGTLSPAQIAAVVGFVRTHFGNRYGDAVTPEFVRAAAGPVPVMEK
jgi:mono/diheme cytochrome c family protein